MKRKFVKVIRLAFFWVYSRICGLIIPLNGKKVTYLSESHRDLDGNLKYMYDYICGKGYEQTVHINGDRRNSGSLAETMSIMRDVTTSKYIFLDDFYGIISAMKVRKGQKLIQLWHGAGAYKKFGYSRIATGDSIKSVHKGYRKYTNVSVTSEHIIPCYAEAFDISADRIRALGIPRTDMFFDAEEKDSIRKKIYRLYPELSDKKVILIAPTYRGRKVEDASYDFSELNLDYLVDNLGSDYKIIVKWHPALVNNIKLGHQKLSLPEGVSDLSDFPDINELLLVTDVLVTDYSSVIFDYFLTGEPIVLFAYDLDSYTGSRGLYFDFDEYTYGSIATDVQQLCESIKKPELMPEKREAFKEKFMQGCDGKAAEKIHNWVFKE